ncbi:choice-of-anchor J domain-containing protein [Motilibacter deserti]|uniref:Immune inhibitor A peptidase M6 n=1 Tax=Motilibacter deserti TaxID=2714956 RepID=A0ABX0GR24_9ACTN|nr:choice-of-anchor J domain-containing protein [Motilibacter deserti]NHC12910.1 hypothetical protein [Motilibacter deserti]
MRLSSVRASRATVSLAVAGAVAVLGLPSSTSAAAPAAPGGAAQVAVREASPSSKLPVYDESGRKIADSAAGLAARGALRAQGRSSAAAADDTPVGTIRSWVALDDYKGRYYLKRFQLRGVGDHIEVWVAVGSQPAEDPSTDTQFLPGDCRNNRTTIGQEQVDYLIDQFDNNIYPLETEVFSVPEERAGADSAIGDTSGAGDNIVTLIDNVRDEHFYDYDNSRALTQIAGFFSPAINSLTDRNVMTIDAFDWAHRTGANPPNEPVPGNNCTSAPARPNLYEGVFAHEYQHLLMGYTDPDESSWVNEGLSDVAGWLTGYFRPAVPVTDIAFENHTQCFLGWLGTSTPANPNPRAECGPENSLTLWGDQGEDETLADYGAAFTFFQMVHDRYGVDAISRLHNDEDNGFDSVANMLEAEGRSATPADLVHEWAALNALDGVLDRSPTAYGSLKRRYSTPSLDSTVNWDENDAYDTPGAPPNGSDYVRLRNASGAYLRASDVQSIDFDGGTSLDSLPVQWTVDADPPDRPGNPALWSGNDNNLDAAIIRQVTVPASSPTLSFATKWSTEPGYDSGFVQVSTDGARTWTSLGNADTVTELDPAADLKLVENLPGFNGEGGWKTETFDLSAYAGQTVMLSFRYISDVNTNGEGWWVDDVTVGGTLVSDGSTTAGWSSQTELVPVPVSGFTVQVIGYASDGSKVDLVEMKLDDELDGQLRGGKIRSLFGPSVDTVAAIVTYDEPTEQVTQLAPYELRVNGVLQPGG